MVGWAFEMTNKGREPIDFWQLGNKVIVQQCNLIIA